jgi:hypothetical protein
VLSVRACYKIAGRLMGLLRISLFLSNKIYLSFIYFQKHLTTNASAYSIINVDL